MTTEQMQKQIPDTEITHDAENRMFRVQLPGGEGYLKYRKVGPTILEYYEVVVPVAERNQGVGTALTEEALRYAQRENFLIAPTCNFVAAYLEDHPEYAELRVPENIP